LSSSDDANDHTHALGLYTLAIEEFGKAILFKKCFNYYYYDDPNSQKIPKAIFRRKHAHELKFENAMEHLPPECKDIMVGTYLPFPSGQPTNVRVARKGPYVPVPAGVSGNLLFFSFSSFFFICSTSSMHSVSCLK
jgi:hypothetical protein